MLKSSKISQIAIDKSTNLVYNISMTNNNNNTKTQFLKGTNNMTNLTYDVRVIKHIDGVYDTFANFTTVKEAVAYMRNWNPNALHSWYILDANGRRLQMNQAGTSLVVTYSGLGVLATKSYHI
jgi:hypothetical protein